MGEKGCPHDPRRAPPHLDTEREGKGRASNNGYHLAKKTAWTLLGRGEPLPSAATCLYCCADPIPLTA